MTTFDTAPSPCKVISRTIKELGWPRDTHPVATFRIGHKHGGSPCFPPCGNLTKAKARYSPGEKVVVARPVAVNRRNFFRFVCFLRSYCPMPNFELIEGSSCVGQLSHENLRRDAAENAL